MHFAERRVIDMMKKIWGGIAGFWLGMALLSAAPITDVCAAEYSVTAVDAVCIQ